MYAVINIRCYAFGLDCTCRSRGPIEAGDESAGEMVEASTIIQGYVSCGWTCKRLSIQTPLNLSISVESFHMTLGKVLLTDAVARCGEILKLKRFYQLHC